MSDEKLDALVQHWPDEATRGVVKEVLKLESGGYSVMGQKEEVDPMSALNDSALAYFGQLLETQREKNAAELERMKTDLSYFFEKYTGTAPTEYQRQMLAYCEEFSGRDTTVELIMSMPGLWVDETQKSGKWVPLSPERYRIVEKPDISGYTQLAVEFIDEVPKGEVAFRWTQKPYLPLAGRIDEVLKDIRHGNGRFYRQAINRALRGIYVHSHKGRAKRRHGSKLRTIYGALNVQVLERVYQE